MSRRVLVSSNTVIALAALALVATTASSVAIPGQSAPRVQSHAPSTDHRQRRNKSERKRNKRDRWT